MDSRRRAIANYLGLRFVVDTVLVRNVFGSGVGYWMGYVGLLPIDSLLLIDWLIFVSCECMVGMCWVVVLLFRSDCRWLFLFVFGGRVCEWFVFGHVVLRHLLRGLIRGGIFFLVCWRIRVLRFVGAR